MVIGGTLCLKAGTDHGGALADEITIARQAETQHRVLFCNFRPISFLGERFRAVLRVKGFDCLNTYVLTRTFRQCGDALAEGLMLLCHPLRLAARTNTQNVLGGITQQVGGNAGRAFDALRH